MFTYPVTVTGSGEVVGNIAVTDNTKKTEYVSTRLGLPGLPNITRMIVDHLEDSFRSGVDRRADTKIMVYTALKIDALIIGFIESDDLIRCLSNRFQSPTACLRYATCRSDCILNHQTALAHHFSPPDLRDTPRTICSWTQRSNTSDGKQETS